MDWAGPAPLRALALVVPGLTTVVEERWGTGRVLAGYVAAVLVAAVTGGIVGAAVGDTDGVAALLGGQAGFWLTLVLAVQLSGLERTSSLRRFRDELAWRDVPVGLFVGVLTQLVLLPVLYWPLSWLVDVDELSKPAEELLDGESGIALALVGIGVVVIAPVVEELFFRGLLLETLRRRWSTMVAVAGSSVFFGATHFQPLQFAGLTLAGLVFAVAVVRTGRLGAAIAVHVGFNATTFVLLAM